ncbi:flavin reductase family protein [Chloroflexota bacterium]
MKVEFGAKNHLYPMPITLIGANVSGKPNYITIAYVGIMGRNSLSVSMNRARYTNPGIKENKTFSVNLPSVEIVKETDYCGLVSGKDVDKATLFETFYGKLETAPMVKECPINMECRLIQTLDFQLGEVFIGEIVETYISEQCLTEGLVDYTKVHPILFAMQGRGYWKLGDRFANAWEIGENIKGH